jgi:hypothetical protein
VYLVLGGNVALDRSSLDRSSLVLVHLGLNKLEKHRHGVERDGFDRVNLGKEIRTKNLALYLYTLMSTAALGRGFDFGCGSLAFTYHTFELIQLL